MLQWRKMGEGGRIAPVNLRGEWVYLSVHVLKHLHNPILGVIDKTACTESNRFSNPKEYL